MTQETVSKADAESLAVYYHAYMERPMNDDTAMIVWGGGLLRMQEKTGIELQRAGDLRRIVERAERNLDAQRARNLDAQRARQEQMA